MSECIAGQTYTFRISVFDEAEPTVAKNNPTIGASDFLISINDGTDHALTNTPTVINSSRVIRVILSAAETTAAGANGSIVLKVADASASDGWLGGDIEIKVRGYATATSNDVTTIMNALTTIDDFLDTEIAAIKAKTDNLPSDPADASDIAASFTTLTNKLTKYVQLLARKDAAIATDNATELTAINANGGSGSGTFANTTDSAEALRDRGDSAWITATGFATPANVTAARDAVIADTGATETAILAALEALNDLSAEAVWAYVRRTLTGVPALLPPPIAGSTLNITQAATYGPHTITDLAIPDAWTSARLTMKREDRQSRPDSEAALQILVTNGGAVGDGLKVLNKAATGFEVSGASLAVSGDVVTITIADHITAQLDAVKHRYDIKFYHGDSLSSVVTAAICQVWATPTQTV